MTPELEHWLDERLAQQRQRLLELVITIVERLLNHQIKCDGEARAQELEQQFAKFEQQFAKFQNATDQMQNLLEKLRRLDRAAHNVEPGDISGDPTIN